MKLYLLPALVLAAISFAAFRAAYLEAGVRIRVVLIAAAFILSAPALLYASNYVFGVPFERWFMELRALPGTEALSGLVGALLGMMFASSRLRPGPLNRPILMFCTVGALGLVVGPFTWHLVFEAVNRDEFENRWKDGVCLQSTGYSCLPASTATIMRILGKRVTEEEFALDMGVTVDGVETWYYLRALRARGYDAHFRRIRSLRQAPVPSIIGVDRGALPHAVAVLAKDRQGVTLGDPMCGRKRILWSHIPTPYKPTGTCIVITP